MRRFAFLLTILAAAPVLAQKAPPTAPAPQVKPAENPAAAEEAKRHFQQAVALFNDGNFSAALAEFEAAYHSRPAPAVLYNIGLTQKALFRYTEAIDSLQRYLAESPALAPEQRAQTEELIREMQALLADVSLEITPPGATITIDGRLMGKAANAPFTLKLAAGNHSVEVAADGYRPEHRELMVTAGVPAKMRFQLAAIPRTGKVHIAASQPQAMVAIDGKPVGLAPLDVELPAGGHQLEVSAPKYNVHRSELVVAAGQNRSLEITLERPQHVYEKWYFWTPIAVVAAGAAVGLGVGLTSREGPLAGTLNPGAGKVN
ncbi:MAG: PEGA domain-containing protein [Polyangia bacterium]|jgi:hypothetical protein